METSKKISRTSVNASTGALKRLDRELLNCDCLAVSTLAENGFSCKIVEDMDPLKFGCLLLASYMYKVI